MYPGSKFNVINPSPQEAAMHMVYMARAYPSFKIELGAAIAEGSADEAGKAMLHNIQFLCEFAIPSVTHNHIYSKQCSVHIFDRNL